MPKGTPKIKTDFHSRSSTDASVPHPTIYEHEHEPNTLHISFIFHSGIFYMASLVLHEPSHYHETWLGVLVWGGGGRERGGAGQKSSFAQSIHVLKGIDYKFLFYSRTNLSEKTNIILFGLPNRSPQSQLMGGGGGGLAMVQGFIIVIICDGNVNHIPKRYCKSDEISALFDRRRRGWVSGQARAIIKWNRWATQTHTRDYVYR